MVTLQSVLKSLIRRFTSKKDTSYMLNYLTLYIKEEQIRKDLLDHIIEQRISIHWTAAIISIINFLFVLATNIRTKDVFQIIFALIYLIGFLLVNTGFYYRYKKGLRWTSSGMFISHAILCSYAASPYGTALAP